MYEMIGCITARWNCSLLNQIKNDLSGLYGEKLVCRKTENVINWQKFFFSIIRKYTDFFLNGDSEIFQTKLIKISKKYEKKKIIRSIPIETS